MFVLVSFASFVYIELCLVCLFCDVFAPFAMFCWYFLGFFVSCFCVFVCIVLFGHSGWDIENGRRKLFFASSYRWKCLNVHSVFGHFPKRES